MIVIKKLVFAALTSFQCLSHSRLLKLSFNITPTDTIISQPDSNIELGQFKTKCVKYLAYLQIVVLCI